jgi:hypothetical protein
MSEAAIAPSALGDCALAYARRGWAVFPLRERRKEPLVPKKFGGRGLLDATRDVAKLREWWGTWPEANIGLVTGGASGFFVVDVDPAHGGEEALMALIERHGDWPDTVYARTGGGGVHYLFRFVPGLRNDQAGKLGRGLDIRAEGGYIVAPPSIHPSGGVYAWDLDHHPDERAIAEAPSWLLEILRERTKPAAAGTMPATWRRLVAEGVGEGSRNNAVARLAGKLLRAGVDPYVTLDLVRCWNAQRCRPPLDESELERTVQSIARLEWERRRKQEHGRRQQQQA